MLARERCKVNGAHQSASSAQGVTIHGTGFGVQGSGFGACRSDSTGQGLGGYGLRVPFEGDRRVVNQSITCQEVGD